MNFAKSLLILAIAAGNVWADGYVISLPPLPPTTTTTTATTTTSISATTTSTSGASTTSSTSSTSSTTTTATATSTSSTVTGTTAPLCGCHGAGQSICNTFPVGCNCQCGCFAAGTDIDTPKGPVSIENIRIGDLVYSYDLKTKSVVIGMVGEVFARADKPYEQIELSDGTNLEVTPSHRFYVPSLKQWLPIVQIEMGTVLLSRDRRRVTLVKRRSGKSAGKTMYNFHVLKYRNYFVHGVLVHNVS